MTEGIGLYLQELRTSQRLTTTRLAQKAGIRRATLSEWQAGKRHPRLPELEAVLNALGASDAQRRRAWDALHAPGSMLRLRQATEAQNRELAEIAGTAPHGGDLLRAMRMRKGWTQAALARAMGVLQAALTRWERGERWPDTFALHTLCYLLDAREEEITALTIGRFSLAEGQTPLTPEEIHARLFYTLDRRQVGAEFALEELRLLTLSAQAWSLAGRSGGSPYLLALVTTWHADHLYMQRRFRECREVAARALDIYHALSWKDEFTARAVLRLAVATAQRGDPPSLQSAARFLQGWLPHADIAHAAWMRSEIGLLKVACGQAEEGIALGEEALAPTSRLLEPTDRWFRQLDLARILLRAQRPQKVQELLAEEHPHPYYSLQQAQAYHQTGDEATARQLIQEVLATLRERRPVIDEPAALYYLPEAETLAEIL